jgi:hypothetical protein
MPRQNTPGVDGRPTAPLTASNKALNGIGPTRRLALASADAVGVARASTRIPATSLAHTRR